ncbi:hypothetical protein AX16_010839 [Volvariella volvacea WC 439]|nr:hypothetical protein AX16_010839 [Volvariella volvacea WC 439]
MSVIPDDKLFEHASRAKSKVVLITGAAKGIGKEAALRFASAGARLVLGDLDVAGGEQTVKELKQAGAQAVFQKCNVVQWEDQVALFDLAISTFGVVDIVIPNAGVSEMGNFHRFNRTEDGKPAPPKLTTIQVNLIGVIYTVNLASHYLTIKHDPSRGSWKAVILIGSMASWAGIPSAAMYTASKHAVLGIMRSVWKDYERQGIRIATIHPWFADTTIIPLPIKVLLAGVPLAPVPRIAGAIFHAATNPDPNTNGCAWLIPDGGNVYFIAREEFKLGVYKMMDARINALHELANDSKYYYRLARDLTRLLGKPILKTGITIYAAKLAWNYRDEIFTYVRGLIGS